MNLDTDHLKFLSNQFFLKRHLQLKYLFGKRVILKDNS